MTREEEIKQASVGYQFSTEHTAIGGDVFPDITHYTIENPAFIAGAEWADRNPDKRLMYTKQELLDMGFVFNLNGYIATPQELNEDVENYYIFRKSQWLEKACDWLRNMINSSKDAYELHGMYGLKTESVINDFRKAMEAKL